MNVRTLQNQHVNLSERSYNFTSSLICDISLNVLNILMLREYNRCFPIILKKIFRCHQVKPWITHSNKNFIQRKQNLHKLYKNNWVTCTEYNGCRFFYTYEIRNAKEKYYNNLFTSIKMIYERLGQ